MATTTAARFEGTPGRLNYTAAGTEKLATS